MHSLMILSPLKKGALPIIGGKMAKIIFAGTLRSRRGANAASRPAQY
jgi:hypothetical protein